MSLDNLTRRNLMNKKQQERFAINDLKDMLLKAENAYAQNVAYKVKVEAGVYKTYTYSDVKMLVEALSTALMKLDLKDKRIGLIGENRFEWEISYLSMSESIASCLFFFISDSPFGKFLS